MKIRKENKVDELISHLKEHVNRFINDEVIGVTLNGGLSRGYGDHLSEIDVTVYFSEKGYKDYGEGLYDIKEGICVIKGQLYDVKILNYQTELNRTMSVVTELWDMKYAKILYDTECRIEALFEKHLERKVSFDDVSGPLFAYWWHYKLAGDIWIHREDPFQGHFILNEGVKHLLKVLYLINKQYVPHEKWLVHNLYQLIWLPSAPEILLKQMMDTGNMSMKSLKKRQESFDHIFQAIHNYLLLQYKLPEGIDGTMYGFYKKLMAIVSVDKHPIQDFKEHYGLALLHSDPFADILRIEGAYVIVDKIKLHEIKSEDMYSWHYHVLDEVRKQIQTA